LKNLIVSGRGKYIIMQLIPVLVKINARFAGLIGIFKGPPYYLISMSTMNRFTSTLVFLLVFTGITSAQSRFDITDFGAQADGKTINTAAINRAVKACHEAGGGVVFVPSGIFITGTIHLLSNVNLHLEKGAKLKGSNDLADFQPDSVTRGMIFAFEARNISITGLGEIDGNSDVFFDFTKKHDYVGFDRKATRQGEENLAEDIRLFEDGPVSYEKRPGMTILMLRCEQVLIRDATFRNSPEWTFRIGDSNGVQIEGIKIFNNLLVPNSDGIHCTTSRNVRISNCEIHGGDDAIAITGFGDETGVGGRMNDGKIDYSTRTMGNKLGVCENVVVSNCILQSRSAGVRIGYGDNPIRNCTFQNLVIYDSNRGLGIFNRDRANIENIQFDHIIIETRLHDGNWWGKGEPIHISSIRQRPDIPVGYIKNIGFTNIKATSEAGIVIYASPETILEDIYFSNIRLNIKRGPLSESVGGNFDLRPAYPMSKQMFKHDIPGLSVTHVQGMTIRDFNLKWVGRPASFYTHGIEIGDSREISIINFKGGAAQEGYQPVKLENTQNVQVE